MRLSTCLVLIASCGAASVQAVACAGSSPAQAGDARLDDPSHRLERNIRQCICTGC